MLLAGHDQVIEVWGDFACFSRPEMKVERFSYPVITPSAARGIFDAIFCKPSRDTSNAQFRWEITRVEVLSELKFIGLRRNEVKEKVSIGQVSRWIRGLEAPRPIFADADTAAAGTDQKGRTQRQTMALRDVRYRLHGRIRPWPGWEERLPAMEAQFKRRAASGKCFYQPCFGCREFPAYFRLVEENETLPPVINRDMDFGLMVYDVFDLSKPGSAFDGSCVSLFRARLQGGVMDIPEYESNEVLKGIPGDAPC